MKFTEFKTPTGQSGSLFSISSWWSMILGVIVFLATIAIGQNMLNRVSGRLPFDTQIDPFVKQPSPASNAPMRERY